MWNKAVAKRILKCQNNINSFKNLTNEDNLTLEEKNI